MILLATAPSVVQAWTIDWKWFKTNIWDRIEVSGTRTFGYHSYSVDGDREAFQSLNYYGFGGKRWTDVGAMSFTGRKVGGIANFQATVDTSRFADPNTQRSSIDYEDKRYKVHLGDIQGSLLNTNRFATFNKTLRGASVEYSSGRIRLKGIYSEAKGAAQTISFTGNNTSGPYYLNASQIVPGSESVEVDGVRLKLLDDYVIRYEYGELTFVDRIIAPTSTIVISFEAFGFNSNRGNVQGAAASYDMGKLGRIGIVAMKQSQAGGSALSTRSELFQGAGAASTPYFLQLEPLRSRPIRVLLNGVEQTENVHYRFDPDNPTIFFFTFFVPNTSTIEVIYTPKPTTTVNGDREVLGVDYSIQIGSGLRKKEQSPVDALKQRRPDGGELRIYQATGRLKNDIDPSSGTARGIEANYDLGDYRLRAGWRDIPDGYVSIETRGFNRNEKAFEAGVSYEKDGLIFDVLGSKGDVSVRSTNSSGGAVFQSAQTTRGTASVFYNKIVGEPWRLDLSTLRTDMSQGRTALDTATLSTSRSFDKWNLRFNVESQSGSGPVTEGSKVIQKSIALNTFRVESTFNPNEAWSVVGRAGVSAIRADDDSGTGKDFSLGIEYNPSPKLNVGLVYSLSDAGQLALLNGFQTGYGLGYNGNGFSGGLSGSYVAGVTNLELLNLHSRYEVNERLSIVGIAEQSKTTGSYSSNSKSSRVDVGLDWNLGERALFGFNFSRTNTAFVESPIKSDSTTLNASLILKPAKRWSATANASWLLTGGTSDFNQDSFYFDASLGYLIDDRQRLGMLFRSGQTRGFLPQDDTAFEFAYTYRLWKQVSLIGSYKIRDVSNLEKSGAGAYRARGFDIELRIGF